MSLIDKTIKPFDVTAYRNGELIDHVTDQDLLGHWSAIVFYPGDFTYVCPTELEDLAEHYDEFQAAGCELYACSTDSEFCHKEWHEISDAVAKVQYTMLSDRTHQLTKNFGVLIKSEGQARRGTFVIDPEGKIRTEEIHDNGIGREAKELLRKVKAAQYITEHPNEVCPAHWHTGDATLAPSIDLVGKI